jgi:prevent-host-death family protein
MSLAAEVGAYEAKTHLPELLRGVRQGKHYLITHHGEPIAELCPVEKAREEESAAAVAQMKLLMASSPKLSALDIKALIEDGRD